MKHKYKKNIISLVIVILSIGILPSCGKAIEKTNIKDMSSDSETLLNLSNIGTESNQSQSYWYALGHNIAKAEKGYYFLSDYGEYIMYFDEETHTSFPLCGKAECRHTDSTCNAFLGISTHLLDTIYYYEGYIYLLAYHGNAVFLERVNADGSGREELCKVCESDGGSSTARLVFNGEFAYVFFRGHQTSNTEHTEFINKISLDGKTEERIFEYTGTNLRICDGKSYGNKLFFIIQTYIRDENQNVTFSSLGLYTYDYVTGETGKTIGENISDYSIDVKNNTIYYFVNADGLYKMNLSTKETNKIFEANGDSGSCHISYDGEYIYISNIKWCNAQTTIKVQKKCWVVDPNGTIINLILCDDFLSMYFGDEKFIFGSKIDNSGGNCMVYIDKKEIKNVKEWSRLGSPIK